TKHAPWFVVPADHKWFTRLVVAAAVVDALEDSTSAFRRWTHASAPSCAPRAACSSTSEPTRRRASAEARDQRLALALELRRQPIAELGEELAQRGRFLPPVGGIDREQLAHRLRRDVEAGGVEGADRRQQPDGRLDGLARARAPIRRPPQHPQVLAEAWPQELPVRALAKPVDVEDARRLLERRT